ncbi:AI-2E family transporter [Paracoccus tegillarcae]|uniref:AI-2E family transporter n=1 Tax=Paracoccus tegillarcae TaxID=1529068 RepID=A0A2K9EXU8_9RHOB|nr:AI-2E family transporter [Paracoccus tegillarcae]AUH32912.1 AI-2E family transporter [Paracoccus tegillarcae]
MTDHTPQDQPELPDSPEPAIVKNVSNWAIIGIFLIVLFWFVSYARAFMMPVSLALLLFFVFIPIRRFLERFGVGAAVSATFITLGILFTAGGIGLMASGPISQMMDDAPQISQRLEQRLTEIRGNFRQLEEAAEKLDEVASGGGSSDDSAADGTVSDTQVSSDASGQATVETTNTSDPTGAQPSTQQVNVQVNSSDGPSTMGQALALGPAAFGQLIFTLVLLFFMISSGDLLYLKIVQAFDSLADKRRAYVALREIEGSLSTYLGAITIINAALGIAIGIAMWIWDMPSPMLFGLAAFVLNFIPYLGAIAGVVLSAVVALFVYDDLFTPLLVAGTYLGLTSIEGQLITPYFVSRRLQLNTVVVFLTVAMWAWLWSVIGMIVAVPMLVVLRVLSAHVPGMEKFGNFLAGDIPAEPTDESEAAAARRQARRGRMSDDEIKRATQRAVGD